jgi:hypothetical protein
MHENVYMLTQHYVPSNVYQCVHHNNIRLSLFGIWLGSKELQLGFCCDDYSEYMHYRVIIPES